MERKMDVFGVVIAELNKLNRNLLNSIKSLEAEIKVYVDHIKKTI